VCVCVCVCKHLNAELRRKEIPSCWLAGILCDVFVVGSHRFSVLYLFVCFRTFVFV
jgi:hypothetical protein